MRERERERERERKRKRKKKQRKGEKLLSIKAGIKWGEGIKWA